MSRRQTASSSNIIAVVLAISFGLVALVFGYQAVKTSSELRSHAAGTETIYKQWEFTSGTPEGWTTSGTVNSVVKNGYLTITQKKAQKPTAFVNTSVGASLPKGLKTVSFSLAVGSDVVPTTNPKTVCPTPPTCGGRLVAAYGKVGACPMYQCGGAVITGSTGIKPINVNPESVQTNVQGVSDVSQDALFAEAVTQNIVCAQDVRSCPDDSYVGRGGPQCVFLPCAITPAKRLSGQVYYRLANKRTFERPLEFSGTADGKFHEYKLSIPNIDSVGIEQLRFVLTSGVKSGDTISVDWIRLGGTILANTPSPVPPVGCRYETVTCIMAPCNPVLVCTPSSPSPTPYSKFTTTCIPRPPCMDAPTGQSRCLPAQPIDGSFCPPNATPYPTASNKPCQPIPTGCIDSKGQMICKIKLMAGYELCPMPQVPLE